MAYLNNKGGKGTKAGGLAGCGGPAGTGSGVAICGDGRW